MGIIIITGISSGLGKELVELSLNRNEKVIGIGRRFTEDQKALLSRSPQRVILIEYDLFNSMDFIRLREELKSNIGNESEITFIHNAGVINPIAKVGGINSEKNIENHININYTLPVLLTNFLMNHTEKNIRILNISSGAAESLIEGWGLYCSSKKAYKVFLDVAEKESLNLSVKHIDPGVMNTEMQSEIRKATELDFPEVNYFKGLKTGGVLRDPKDVAAEIIKRYLEK